MQASAIARNTFDTPEQLIDIMDSLARPENAGELERKRHKSDAARVDFQAYKLDQVAPWKEWVAMLGIRLKGLRSLAKLKHFFAFQLKLTFGESLKF